MAAVTSCENTLLIKDDHVVERKAHSLLYKLIIFQKFLNTRDLTFYSCSVHRTAHFPLCL